MTPTLEYIRAQLRGRGMVGAHSIPLVDAIEARAEQFPDYAAKVARWLDPHDEGSTLLLRDEICEVVRYYPHIIEIGKQFNPTTEWHNTWVPLDTARHRIRHNIDPDTW